ncbi:hypothetical protein GCM10010970_07560 [Silvimonas iriomotensis]|uniref:Uncharacterized protein n=1 Tax=Silvimonas iriomotensis TaxID=449662 RepID=A0ABQ2P5T3_9NEIS|nr:hypothetical protein GCM10010970_07560 [Silvimonas iriomotensis]
MDKSLLFYLIGGSIAVSVLYAVLLVIYIARIFMKKTVLTNPDLLQNIRLDFKAGDPVARIRWPVHCTALTLAFLLLFIIVKNRMHQ